MPDSNLAPAPDPNSVSVAGLGFSALIYYSAVFHCLLFLFSKFVFGATSESLFWKSFK